MPSPLYKQLATEIRGKINRGEFRQGTQLPSEKEFAEAYRMSRNTVRLALDELAKEGLVEAKQGLGRFVREIPKPVMAEVGDPPPQEDVDTFVYTVTSQGQTPDFEDFRVEIRAATEEVAEGLGLEKGDKVVVRSFRGLINGRPWSIQESSYPLDLAQDTLIISPDNIPHGAVRELANHGYPQDGYEDVVSCRMPTPDELTFFDDTPGLPVLVVRRIAYSKGRPIRLTVTVYAGDRVELKHVKGDVPVR